MSRRWAPGEFEVWLIGEHRTALDPRAKLGRVPTVGEYLEFHDERLFRVVRVTWIMDNIVETTATPGHAVVRVEEV